MPPRRFLRNWTLRGLTNEGGKPSRGPLPFTLMVDLPGVAMAQLRTLTPAVDWTRYFRAIGLTAAVTRVNVAEPDFLARLQAKYGSAIFQQLKLVKLPSRQIG